MAVPPDDRDRLPEGAVVTMAKVMDDPFHHLHDEAYAARFLREANHETLITTEGGLRHSLDGDWRLTLDLFEEGLRQNWPALDDAGPTQWSVPRDYELSAGETVPVPSCWNLLRPEWMFFEGMAWYARFFDWQPDERHPRWFLHFGGVNYQARVFLNGVFLGSHQGGSTPFSIDVTEALRPGNNRLQVAVENKRQSDRVPMHHFDWFNYGGIYRDVTLIGRPAVFIRDMGVALVPDGRYAAISVDVTLSDAVDGNAVFFIPELGIAQPVAVHQGKGQAVIAATPELWSPASPRLYDVTVSFDADMVHDRVGFRQISVSGTEILLNGEPIYLAGVCVHEDDLAAGRVSDEADLRRRFQHARELGCNFLRLAHYPHHAQAARLADELGFLLWAEIPVYWAIDFRNGATYRDAENQLLEMIGRDRNRASIVIWGVGNENADTDDRYSFMSRLAGAAREADGTRLISAACLINRESFRIEDRLAAHLDIIGLNEYFGWYEPNFSGLRQLLANSEPGKPVIVSETGADAMPGYHRSGRVLFTEDWQGEFFRQQFALLDTASYVRGVAVWLLYDFRSERRQTGFQRGFNRKGLIAEDKKTKKAAFAVVAEAFRKHSRPA